MALYDLDAREKITSMMALMQFDLPFTGIMPDEFEYRSTNVRFVYSDLGISANKLSELMELTVRHNGIDRKFAYVTVSVEFTDEYDDVDERFVTINHTVAVFE